MGKSERGCLTPKGVFLHILLQCLYVCFVFSALGPLFYFMQCVCVYFCVLAVWLL